MVMVLIQQIIHHMAVEILILIDMVPHVTHIMTDMDHQKIVMLHRHHVTMIDMVHHHQGKCMTNLSLSRSSMTHLDHLMTHMLLTNPPSGLGRP